MLFLVFVMICSFSAFSQRAKKPNPYSFGVGVGYNPSLESPVSINIKFYTLKGNAFEFIGYNLHTGYRLTSMFLPYLPISRDGRLRGLLGFGMHIGWWKEEFKTNSYHSNPIVGGDAIVGFEYRIPKLPVSLQAHYQPSGDLAGNNQYFYGKEMLGVAARIVF